MIHRSSQLKLPYLTLALRSSGYKSGTGKSVRLVSRGENTVLCVILASLRCFLLGNGLGAESPIALKDLVDRRRVFKVGNDREIGTRELFG